MKLYSIRLAVLVAAIIASTSPGALDAAEYLAEVHYPLGNAREFAFKSQKAGRKYKILVRLPGSYATSGANIRYPVLYTVDGQWHFSIAGSVVGGLYYDRGARESIVVGITWDGDEANANRLRAEDFTPTSTEFVAGSGKADSYLDFLQYELIPYMAENYRTSEDRTLSGSSYGGLLTLYCLFTRPTLFSDYLASSPATWWDEGVIRKYQASFTGMELPSPVRLYVARGGMEYAHHGIDVFVNEPATWWDEGVIRKYQASFAGMELPSPVRLYVARGGMEYAQHGIDVFVNELKAENHRNLEIEFDVIEGAGHGGLNPEAFTRGVQYIFKKNRVHIDEKQLAGYTGSYKGPSDWPDIEISSMDGNLYSMDPKTKTEFQLVAVGENLFYVANAGAEVSFSIDENEHVTHMNLKVENGEFSFEKQTLD